MLVIDEVFDENVELSVIYLIDDDGDVEVNFDSIFDVLDVVVDFEVDVFVDLVFVEEMEVDEVEIVEVEEEEEVEVDLY